MQKKFHVTLVSECPEYEVMGNMATTMEAVWDSQKHWFMPGTKVLITDESGNARLFEKRNENVSIR